ncbi:hypothetical protein C8R45DRAFT_1109646 [Mycena sanguinolenta]|nr:hypothetical protein C8R45DRAFT_1109646 [Mycena sanguinolenta]
MPLSAYVPTPSLPGVQGAIDTLLADPGPLVLHIAHVLRASAPPASPDAPRLSPQRLPSLAYTRAASSSCSILRSLLVPAQPAPRILLARSAAHSVPRLVPSASQSVAATWLPPFATSYPPPPLLSRAPLLVTSRAPPILHPPTFLSQMLQLCTTTLPLSRSSTRLPRSTAPFSSPLFRLASAALALALHHVDLDALPSFLDNPTFSIWRPHAQARRTAMISQFPIAGGLPWFQVLLSFSFALPVPYRDAWFSTAPTPSSHPILFPSRFSVSPRSSYLSTPASSSTPRLSLSSRSQHPPHTPGTAALPL